MDLKISILKNHLNGMFTKVKDSNAFKVISWVPSNLTLHPDIVESKNTYIFLCLTHTQVLQ